MSTRARSIGFIAAVFAVVGVGVGAVGYVGADWATGIFYLQASGDTAAQFGPIFVALVAFQIALLAFVLGPLLAGVLGVLVGSQQHVRREAVTTTAGGAFVGFVLLGVIAVPVASAGIGGGVESPFSVGGFAVRLVAAAIPTTVVGALAGVVGAEFMT